MPNKRKPSRKKLGFVVSVCVTLFHFSLLTSSHVIQIFPIYLVYVCVVMLVGFTLRIKRSFSRLYLSNSFNV